MLMTASRMSPTSSAPLPRKSPARAFLDWLSPMQVRPKTTYHPPESRRSPTPPISPPASENSPLMTAERLVPSAAAGSQDQSFPGQFRSTTACAGFAGGSIHVYNAQTVGMGLSKETCYCVFGQDNGDTFALRLASQGIDLMQLNIRHLTPSLL